jgi:hypothetical protein
VPSDVATCKKNLFLWLSAAVDHLNANKAGVIHCWETTQLLKAWDRCVQAEAMSKVKELFPNLATADAATVHDDAIEEDETAGGPGLPFTQPDNEDDDEWEQLLSEDEDEDEDEQDA